MTYEQILFETKEGVAWIRLNRPEKLNALTQALATEAIDALEICAKEPEIRCVVITGEGRGFCAGQDLTEFQQQDLETFSVADHLRQSYNRMIQGIIDLPKPVVAGVNGVAAGAGLSLAAACDIRIASDAASFVQAFVKIGLVPDSGGNWLLPRIVGYARALELSITGRKVDADEAFRIGLVHAVVPGDRFSEELETQARWFAHLPTRAIGATKRIMSEALQLSLPETLEREAVLQQEQAGSEDFREGVTAFTEKREPRFTGR
jgi:2-(1,2-epoxy-1,2-dihydrophenyl)acetyl-CoA isomerase